MEQVTAHPAAAIQHSLQYDACPGCPAIMQPLSHSCHTVFTPLPPCWLLSRGNWTRTLTNAQRRPSPWWRKHAVSLGCVSCCRHVSISDRPTFMVSALHDEITDAKRSVTPLIQERQRRLTVTVTGDRQRLNAPLSPVSAALYIARAAGGPQSLCPTDSSRRAALYIHGQPDHALPALDCGCDALLLLPPALLLRSAAVCRLCRRPHSSSVLPRSSLLLRQLTHLRPHSHSLSSSDCLYPREQPPPY